MGIGAPIDSNTGLALQDPTQALIAQQTATIDSSINSMQPTSPSYTQPQAGTPGAQTYSQAQLLAALQQQQQQQAYGVTPQTGISPSTAGSLAGKGINQLINPSKTFTNDVNAINNWGAENLGTAAPTTSASGTNLGLGNFVNASGDSVAANSPGAIAAPGTANADLINSFASAQNSTSLANGTAQFVNASGDSVAAGTPGAIQVGATQASALAGSSAPSASGLQSALGIDPTSTLGSLTAPGSLTGVLGAAGIGALAGGYIAGFEGGNSTGGEIGGAIGAAAGDFFGGPIGGAVGSFIGSSIGGLFGNHSAPTAATSASGTFTPNGAITPVQGGSKNAGSLQNFGVNGVSQFSQMAQGASSVLGINFAPTLSVGVNLSTLHGGASISVADSKTGNSTNIPFNYQSQASAQAAELQALQFAAAQSGYTNTAALNTWYNNASGTGSNFTPPTPPSVAVNGSSFAAYMANNPNANSNSTITAGGNTSPTV